MVLSVRSVYTYVQHIELFEYRDNQIIGNTFIDDNVILEYLNIPPDATIFEVNIEELQNQLCQIEFIRAAKISRILPSNLIVEIIERKPIAYIDCGDIYVVLDDTGEILSANSKVKAHFQLPLISGAIEQVACENLFNIDGFETLTSAYHFMNYLSSNYQSVYQGISICQMDDTAIVLINKTGTTKIYLTQTNYVDQLLVLHEFQRTVKKYRNLADYQYIDLRVIGQVVVKENLKVM